MRKVFTVFCLAVATVVTLPAQQVQQRQPQPNPQQGTANQPMPQGYRSRDLGTPIRITRDMRRGDVVARGNVMRRAPGRPPALQGADPNFDCEYDFGVSISLRQGSRAVYLTTGPNCTVVIDRIEDEDVIELENNVVQGKSVPMNPIARLWNAFVPTLHAQWNCYNRCKQKIYSHIMTWGLATPAYDGLTAQQGWLEFSYQSGQATQLYGGTYGWACVAGVNPYTGLQNCQSPLNIPPMFPTNIGWWATNFFIGPGSYPGPGSSINRLDQSDFFLDRFPLREYQHTLFNRRIGYGGGGGTCSLYYSGSIPFGLTPVPVCQVSPPVPY